MAGWYGSSFPCLTLYLTSENSWSTRTHVLSSMYCSLYSIQLSWLKKISRSFSWPYSEIRSLFCRIFQHLNDGTHFCVCYLRMQMQTLCRAVEILITTSCSTSVKFLYRGLTEVFIASPFCDYRHEGQVKRNHLSWICREPRWMSSLNRELS